MNFDHLLRDLYTLKSGYRRTSLQPYQDFLQKLGHPQRGLPPVIHVAGTNGKGSTVAMLKSLLNQAGYRTHVYTSPHLVDVTERIQLNGKPVPRNTFQHYLEQVMPNNPQSFFEALTACAFLAFQDHDTDFILLETGLGGRLDPTNVVDPLCSVITSIGWDHEKYLGNTLELIAQQKAGIIKPGRPAVLQSADPTLQWLVNQYATDVYLSRNKDIAVSLSGPHQRNNASLALSVLEVIGVSLTDSQKSQALNNVHWPGRFQRVQSNGQTWILDGAHNKSAAQALAETLREQGLKNLPCLFSLEKSRCIQGFLTPLKDVISKVYALQPSPIRQGHTYQEIAAACQKLGLSCAPVNAVEELRELKYILVTGSLHLVGHALKTSGYKIF